MALDLETREQLIDTVRRFVTERLRPLEAKVAEDDAMPDDVLDEMKALGLYGLSIPEQYGGLDLSMEDECLVAVELGRTSPAFRSAFGTNVGIGSQGLCMFGTDAQKQKYLPGIASGEIITSFALTEPEVGSDSANVQTRAILDGDCYVLNGAKRFITNANKADLFTVMARSDPDKPGAGGVSAFLVDRNLPGLSVGKPEKKMGQQGAHICDVIFRGQPPGPGGRGLQGRHAGARPWALAHLGGLRRRR
jgi:acyl-CoA dehydrogenase